ncbi:MAG: 30S ribosomal protein S9 [Candidatus Spechtbacterales bacterium]
MAKEIVKKSTKKVKNKYYEAVGRRKTSSARVRIWEEKAPKFVINDKDYIVYLSGEKLAMSAAAPLRKTKTLEKFSVSAKVKGGGITGQTEAVRHGLARALVSYDPEFRTTLKKSGYLKRDPRKVERKKPGLKKARRAPQWSKR